MKAFKAVSGDMEHVMSRVEAMEGAEQKRVVRFITNGGNA